jgi:hypothetical protein
MFYCSNPGNFLEKGRLLSNYHDYGVSDLEYKLYS